MEITIDSEEVSERAFNEIVRIAQSGESSELFKDAVESWIMYTLSLCHPETAGYADTGHEIGTIPSEIHGILADTEGTPFDDIQDTEERDEIESVLENLEQRGIVTEADERYYLDSDLNINA